MKNFSVFALSIVSLLFITACSGPKSPSFLKLEDLKVAKASRTNVILKADAVYHNSNNVSGTLTETNMKILVNDLEVTEINQRHSIPVPKESDFRVPVTIQFNPQKLNQENKGFLRKTLKSFLGKSMEVKYTGTITVEVLNIEFDVPVDYSEKVSLGLNYD